MNRAPSAVLWDMDGTVCNTEPYWFDAERHLAAEHGAEWTEQDALEVVGWGLLEAAALIGERIGSKLTAAQIVDILGHSVAKGLAEDIPWLPGVKSLYTEFADAGIPQALVTMSYSYIAQPIVDALGFETAVTGDSVTHAKPHPEPYLRAAELLGVDPTDCLAIEDSPTGSASANAAGCFVVVVPNVARAEPAQRRLIVPSLAEVTADQLMEARTA